MNNGQRLAKYLVAAVLASAAGLWGWQFAERNGKGATVYVDVPALSALATSGKSVFDVNCAPCHGVHAAGTDKGPPLVHAIYHPGHHSDGAFFLAAKIGVRQHHWRYGDMPPQPGLSEAQLAAVVRYIRELQVTNTIEARPRGQ